MGPLFKDADAGPGSRKGVPKDKTRLKLHPRLLAPPPASRDGGRGDGGGSSGSWRGGAERGRPRGGGGERGGRRDEGRRGDDRSSSSGYSPGRGGRTGRDRDDKGVPSFPYVARRLKERALLPSIVFLFSRNGCEQAAKGLAKSSPDLLTDDERTKVSFFFFSAAAPSPRPGTPPSPPTPLRRKRSSPRSCAKTQRCCSSPPGRNCCSRAWPPTTRASFQS